MKNAWHTKSLVPHENDVVNSLRGIWGQKKKTKSNFGIFYLTQHLILLQNISKTDSMSRVSAPNSPWSPELVEAWLRVCLLRMQRCIDGTSASAKSTYLFLWANKKGFTDGSGWCLASFVVHYLCSAMLVLTNSFWRCRCLSGLLKQLFFSNESFTCKISRVRWNYLSRHTDTQIILSLHHWPLSAKVFTSASLLARNQSITDSQGGLMGTCVSKGIISISFFSPLIESIHYV